MKVTYRPLPWGEAPSPREQTVHALAQAETGGAAEEEDRSPPRRCSRVGRTCEGPNPGLRDTLMQSLARPGTGCACRHSRETKEAESCQA